MPTARCATYFAGVVGILTAVLFSTNAPMPSANDTSIIMAPALSLLPTATTTIPADTITITITTTAVIEITASPAASAPSSGSVPLSASATTNAK
ncbi:MAG: hypothetical protein Q9191_005134, partial [Dirinaria sp. TL-2023a]